MLRIERAGAGAPVILVHGFLGSARMWESPASRLARHFDVVAVDLPGFGRDTARTVPDRIEGFARAVVDTADQLGFDRFHLLGHSMGGMVAQQVALDCGGRVDRLVLYGTAGSGRLPGRFEPIRATITRMHTDGVHAVGCGIVRSWFTGGEAASGYAACVSEVANVTLATAVAALTAIDRWDVRGRLNEVTARCLIIGGDADRSTPPAELLDLFNRLPRTDLCILPHCAHAAHLEHPDLFDAVVGGFLSAPVDPPVTTAA